MLVAARRLEQHMGAVDVGLHELSGFEQGPVDMRLGSEVDDGVDVLGGAVNRGAVANVPLNEG